MTNDYWPTIPKSEYVDIIAPSGTFSASDLDAIDHYLTREGFRPRIPKNILGRLPIFANSDEIRFDLLKNALTASDSTLLWCVRGGHGVSRIMPQLTQLAKPNKQKLLVGFSDISLLHLWLNQVWQWPSLQGPAARQTAHGEVDAEDVATLNKIGHEGIKNYSIAGFQALNQTARDIQHLQGITSGGCISVLQTSIGTPWQIDGRDKILFLEDVNEAPYRLDRLLVHLANAGILQQAKAFVFGDFGENNEVEARTMEAMLNEVINNYFPSRGIQLPAFRLRGFAHGFANKPLPFGVSAQLTRDDETSWHMSF
jgi:muramoyltetrapeptide carboxypeptidase